MTNSAELIICIVNQGYEETVIQSANTVGVIGGTFLGAQGSAFSIPVDDMSENLKQQLFGKPKKDQVN